MNTVISIFFVFSIMFSEVFYYEKYEDKDGDRYNFTTPVTSSDNWKYKEVVSLVNGKKEGKSVIYEKGEYLESRRLEGFYKNDVKDSLWTTYYVDGQKKAFLFNYRKGIIDGLYVWYYPSGYVQEIGYFKNGLRDSIEEDFYDNSITDYTKSSAGKIKSRCRYKMGKIHGEYSSYHENGVVETRCLYNYGILEGLYKNYHDNGKLESEYQIESGDFGKFTDFYNNGEKETEGKYKNYARIGKWTYYYSNGNIEKEGSYSENEMDGEWTYFNSDHSKTKTINFTAGVADSPVPNWDQPEYQWGKNELLETSLGSKSTKEGYIYEEKDRFNIREIPMLKLTYSKLYNKSHIKTEWYKYNVLKSRYEQKNFLNNTTEPGWTYIWFYISDTAIGKWKICVYDNDNKIKELYFTIEE